LVEAVSTRRARLPCTLTRLPKLQTVRLGGEARTVEAKKK
jgi:hypothetical protein